METVYAILLLLIVFYPVYLMLDKYENKAEINRIRKEQKFNFNMSIEHHKIY